MNALYRNLSGGDAVSDGEVFGIIHMAAFGYVLVNWSGVNPLPLPPISYPHNLWDFLFGLHKIVGK